MNQKAPKIFIMIEIITKGIIIKSETFLTTWARSNIKRGITSRTYLDPNCHQPVAKQLRRKDRIRKIEKSIPKLNFLSIFVFQNAGLSIKKSNINKGEVAKKLFPSWSKLKQGQEFMRAGIFKIM